MKLGLWFKCAAAAAGLAAAGLAQAGGNVYWSVGAEVAPGVSVGVGNAPPVLVAPAPLYAPVYARPVYTQPVYARPVVYPRPVYVAAPVIIAPRWVPPGHRKHKHKHHHH